MRGRRGGGNIDGRKKKLREAMDPALLECEERFSLVFRSSPVAMGISRLADGRFIEVNDAFLQIFGYGREEIIGHNSDELGLWLDPEQQDRVVAALREHGHDRDLEMKCRRKSGEIGDLLASAERIELAGEECFLGTFFDITRRKKIEEAFRENERHIRAVVEDQTEVICRFKADGTFKFVNDVYCRLFAKRKEDLLGSRWHPIAVPEDIPIIEERLALLSPANPVVVIENRVYSGSGEILWMQFVNRAFYDDAGRLQEIQAVGRDISERKRAEEALQESEEFKNAVLNSMASNIAVVDRDGVILSVNEPWRRFTLENPTIEGLPASRTGPGSNYLAVCRESSGDSSEEAMAAHDGITAVLEGTLPSFSLEYPCHSPAVQRWFTMTVTPLGAGRGRAVITHTNITGRKLAEEAFRKSEERLNLALTSSRMGVWEWNLPTNAVIWSPECFVITGNDKFNGTVDSFSELLHPDDKELVWNAVNNALSEKTTYAAEFRIIRPDGEVRWLSDLGRAEYDGEGNPIRLVGTVRDITENRKVEQELKYRQEIINSMAMELSVAEERERCQIAEQLHDQIAPKLFLTKMKVHSLLDRLPPEDYGPALDAIDALIDLGVEDIRSLTFQLRPPILADMGLEAALRWLGEEFSENYGLRVQIKDDKKLKPLKYELRSAIFQIVRELLLNVAKHAGTKDALISVKSEKENIVVTVEDSGVGFDVENSSLIKPRSGGFGMFNTRMKIEYLGGGLSIVSSPGRGTRVSIRAPLDTTRTRTEKQPWE